MRIVALASLLLLPSAGCGTSSEEDHGAVELGEAPPAVTYTEMRLTPRGTQSGLQEDLFPFRLGQAEDPVAAETAYWNVDLERRADLRAYEGAPPTIPHAVQQNAAPECLTCHGERLVLWGRTARPICHEGHATCTTCHVQASGSAPGGADLAQDSRDLRNTFVGLREQAESREPAEGAPDIPHRLILRERCPACHGVNGPARGHHSVDFAPERELDDSLYLSEEGGLVCRTCHTMSTSVETFGSDAAVRTTPIIDDPSELCLRCHEDSHEPVFERLGLSDGLHPGGAELDADLVASIRRDGRPSGCHGCHGSSGALEQGVLRDAGEGRVCAVCHRNEAVPTRNHPVGGPEQPDRSLPSDLPTGEHGEPICSSCHDLVDGIGTALLRSVEDGPLCIVCHEEHEAVLRGLHGETGRRSDPCSGCHQVHGSDRERNLLGTAPSGAADPDGCLDCHGPGESAAPERGRPGVLGHPVDGELHTGQVDPLTCTACHDVHEPEDEDLACGSCHEDQDRASARGGHGTAECGDCHPAHDAPPQADVAGLNPAAQRCLACHGATVGLPGISHVEEYEHPKPIFTPGGPRWEPLRALPLYGPDGTPVEEGANGDLTCSTCHITHGPDPIHPSDGLRRPSWRGVCKACHGKEALLLYHYFHEREHDSGAAP